MTKPTFLKAVLTGLCASFMLAAAPAEDTPAPAAPPPATKTSIHKVNPDFIHPTMASNSTEKVGTRLVCLFDISGSIDDVEYDVQIEAMASAIESEDFKHAIFLPGGPESIALCVADFSSRTEIRIPWLDIRKGEEYKLKALAKEIRALTRRESGMTDQIGAYKYTKSCIANCPWEANKTIVDIITDGTHNGGGSLDDLKKERKELATKYEATINALITLDTYSNNFKEWCEDNLVTPATYIKKDGMPLKAGFAIVVATQQSDDNEGAITEYKNAMILAFRRKLILEIVKLDSEEQYDNIAIHPEAIKSKKHIKTTPDPRPAE